MDAIGLVYYLLFAFVMTTVLLLLFLKASHKYHWFDKPDEQRKLHSINKPTSAGLLFMLPVVLDLLWLPNPLFVYSYIVGGSLLVLLAIGGIDDFHPISSKFKLLIISTVSALFIYVLFKGDPINHWLLVVYLLGLIWWINLFNFMDGADGMVTLHAIISIFGYSVIFYLSQHFEVLTYLYLMLVCLLAFLLFNFPTSRIFMGDSGSLSLSFFIAVFALYGISIPLFDWVLVMTIHLVFIVDASLTLVTRLKYKHRFTSAHKLHFYQCHIDDGKSHTMVSFLYFVVSILMVATAVILYTTQVSFLIRLLVLMIYTLVLSFYWFNYHNKTKFKRFIQ